MRMSAASSAKGCIATALAECGAALFQIAHRSHATPNRATHTTAIRQRADTHRHIDMSTARPFAQCNL
jgi:hypothetical protein